MIDWLVTTALAALALAAVAGVFIWAARPAPAVRHALWLVVLLKLVSPTGLVVSVPLPVDRPAPTPSVETPPTREEVVEAEIFTVVVTPRPGQTVEEAAAEAVRPPAGLEPPPRAADPAPPPRPTDYRPYLLAAWAAGALGVGYRQVRETVRFARFARRAFPAGDALAAEVAAVAGRLGVRPPAVRVLPGLASPVIWSLWRPVLLWPAGLECRLKGDGRRAVIAHELAHLRRRDHWVRRLEMAAAVLHWWDPLFWLARRRLRADAELACDAWAAGQADRRAYAEALLEVCSFRPRRRPAPAVGVLGEGRRALQERLTMIMRDRIPCQLAFGAKLVVALMALAAIPTWTLGQGQPVQVEVQLAEKAPPPAPADPQVQALEEQIKALAEKLAAVRAAKLAEREKAAAQQAQFYAQLAEKAKGIRVEVEAKDVLVPKPVAAPVQVLVAGQDGVKVIGPDGKEIPGARVLIGEGPKAAQVVKPLPPGTVPEGGRIVIGLDGKGPPAADYIRRTVTAGGADTITLSRATYKVGKEQATALATLLGAIKATVMETRVDGDAITVTTTPEAQTAIGQIVRLIQGQPGGVRFRWTELVLPPAAPKAPTPPPPPGAKPTGANITPSAVDQPKPVRVELRVDPETGHGDVIKVLDALKGVAPIPVEVIKPAPPKVPAPGM